MAGERPRLRRIYLDNCCFNRPFDDQSQIRIRIETEAKLFLQQEVLEKRLELAWSYILDFENAFNPFPERKAVIARWRHYAIVRVIESSALLRQMAFEPKTRFTLRARLRQSAAIS
jgi:hypothetical protein